MELLVTEGSSRQDVLKLAESLKREFACKYLCIYIFDSREAWRIYDDKNEEYSDEEFMRRVDPHLLVLIDSFDGQQVHWLPYDRNGEQAEKKRDSAQVREKAERQRKDAIEAARWRTWTDATGTYHIEAKYGGVIAGVVRLVKRDGSVLKLPREKLSDEDKEWIAKESKRR
jgi:hypothetical protein